MLHEFQSLISRKTRARNRTTDTDPKRRHVANQGEAGSGKGMPMFLSGNYHAASTNFGTIHGIGKEKKPELAANPTESEAPPVSVDPTAATADTSQASAETIPQVAPVAGVGQETQAVAYGLALRGRTDANFSNSFSTVDTQTKPGKDCAGCTGAECVQVAGTLESTFSVATQVTLPSVADFPNLTPCQRQRVQTAITTVLAPHEQQHVAAFRAYNGITRTKFNLTLCRSEFDSRIQSMHEAAETTRQASAQAASDALDPFEFEVDLNCQDQKATLSPPSQAESATTESELA